MRRSFVVSILFVFLTTASNAPLLAVDQSDETAAVIQFQRSVDSYAFLHRQIDRRNEGQVDQRVMNDAMRRGRPTAADGDMFTPVVSDVLRKRIAQATRQGCDPPAESTSSEIPRVGSDSTGSVELPTCLSNVLPRLPAELEYRAAGVVLILVDTHARLVVDVLHGAFPAWR